MFIHISSCVLAGLHRLSTPLLATTTDHALLQADWVHNFTPLQQKNPTTIAAAVTNREPISRKDVWRMSSKTEKPQNWEIY
ncbi:hypothetical protein [Entomobacter blattae]|uniref:Secreted protein n=1 Tax=Entomobacter blattae TaxID=2762277 RepID=A0A7H1NRG4_9PROT|nr:hypothetical protein [Entomobacter blattae]QNT78374.1 hypothetical protein JGUZn3_11470 [Entomobacter blattae]